MNYYLPQAIAQLLTEGQLKKCKNLGLILDKYPPQTAVQKSEGKGAWLKEIAAGSYIDYKLTESVYRRWLNMIKAVGAFHFDLITDWRMVVGLGGESVLETDLTLHHLYGIPYIPGSALKGLTRAFVTGEIYPSKDIDHDNEIVQRIFGTQKKAGTVIFFDAMPIDGKATFELDIMNSHYPNYYGEKKLPTNDQNPNPVTFLTVANTAFTFALAPRRPEFEQDARDTLTWLRTALEKYGAGGKTSAGYGYFKEIAKEDSAALTASAASTSVISSPAQTPGLAERIRPHVPSFREGQEIPGFVVIAPTEELRQRVPLSSASALLRYKEFSPKDLVVAIAAEFPEAQTWQPGDTRTCIFIREEQRGDYVVWFCKPRAKKGKDKQK